MMNFSKKYKYIPLISFPIAISDQITKIIVHTSYQVGESTVVIPGLFSLTYVRNRGAAFGIFATAHETLRQIVLGVVPLIALVMVAFFFRSVPEGKRLMPIALSLVIGGAIGNMIDRYRLGYVIDFFDFYIGHAHWPAFNIADSAICVGIGLMAYHMIFLEKPSNAPHSS